MELNQENITDKSVISVLDTDEDSTWTQLLRRADDRPGSPNNAVRDEVARYSKEKIFLKRLGPLKSTGSEIIKDTLTYLNW